MYYAIMYHKCTVLKHTVLECTGMLCTVLYCTTITLMLFFFVHLSTVLCIIVITVITVQYCNLKMLFYTMFTLMYCAVY